MIIAFQGGIPRFLNYVGKNIYNGKRTKQLSFDSKNVEKY
jgi:hypothetical protein